MRKVVSLFLLVLFVGACSSEKDVNQAKPQRTDSAGRLIAAGEDWSGTGTGERAKEERDVSGIESAALRKAVKCGVPPTLSPEQKKQAPPGFDPNKGFDPPKNDFPFEASITPTRGDPGTATTITAVATGQPKALIVVITRFFDGKDHGMIAATFTDVLGKATLKGPIPEDAPVGLATISVSASTREEKSAVKKLDFIVTGPGCR